MKKTLKRMRCYFRPYTLQLSLSLLCSLAGVIIALLIPVFCGDAIDAMTEMHQVDPTVIRTQVIRLLGVIALSFCSQYVLQKANQKISFSIARSLRNDLIEKIQKLPLSYLDSVAAGQIVSRMIFDVDIFADGVLVGLTQLLNGLLTILGTLIIMFTLNIRITLVVALLTPLSVFVSQFISHNINKYFVGQNEKRAFLTGFINEYVGAEKIVLAFHHEKEAIEDFDKINSALKEQTMKATFYSSLINPSTRFISNVVYAIVALISILSALKGTITIGQVSVFLSYASQYGKPFNDISNVITELQNALVCASNVLDLLDEKEEEEMQEGVEDFQACGNVSMDHVRFGYVKDRILFEDLSLHVKKGQHIAIVGPTGSGKTTLINLLMRFYDVNDGDICLDDTSIYSLQRKALRSNYGMVLQETFLKSGTVFENVAYGKENATLEEVMEACRKVKAHSFIMRLPEGYDTQITENGSELSQGERQLLCIARVMVNLPNILILDEATSSIDTRTEMMIQNAFNAMMQDRTTFIVAHRLSTIREADMIMVMKNGRIAEMGDHESLLRKRGFYYLLYNSQFEN